MILKTVYLHRKDRSNPGDWYCSPYHYHPEDSKYIKVFDINEAVSNGIRCEKFIVGGGGLLSSDPWVNKIWEWSKKIKAKKKIIWGTGIDEEFFDHPLLLEFDLIGVRQRNTPFQYVPCVSCLHPLFDSKETTNDKIIPLAHPKTLKIGGGAKTKRFIQGQHSTNMQKIDFIVNQIKLHDKILTASYHVWYWGKLLGKNVNIDYETNFRKPLKEKFFTLPNITNLEHCRNLNYEFASKVWL
tara:strand:+ start:17016 stop:17738 length:723 start_codon:yes stop_codon:yes gene_type:complete